MKKVFFPSQTETVSLTSAEFFLSNGQVYVPLGSNESKKKISWKFILSWDKDSVILAFSASLSCEESDLFSPEDAALNIASSLSGL